MVRLIREEVSAMSAATDRTEIEALFQRLERAHLDHDADVIVEAYAPDAVIYDLAPPLGRRGMNHDSVAAWLAGWDGPIQIDARDVNLTVDGNLAFVSALNRMRGRIGGVDQDMWFRTTMCLRKIGGRWRIICDHSSVPFYMDGSYRAAVDLKPQSENQTSTDLEATNMDPVVHFEMPYDNRERLAKFYESAFGWQMQVLGEEMGHYVLATTTETGKTGPKKPGAINGGFFPKKPDWPMQHPSVVISVDDIKQAVKKVAKAGGEVLGEPMDIPGVGQYVSFTDTEGNRVGVLQPIPRDRRAQKSEPKRKAGASSSPKSKSTRSMGRSKKRR
jgi:uncharacterized protein (TIGR02246 family)